MKISKIKSLFVSFLAIASILAFVAINFIPVTTLANHQPPVSNMEPLAVSPEGEPEDEEANLPDVELIKSILKKSKDGLPVLMMRFLK